MAKFFVRTAGKDGLGLTNEIIRHTYEFAELVRGRKIETQGGDKCVFHALLRKGANKGFTGPYKPRKVSEPQHMVPGEQPWSVYEASAHVEDIEAALNAGSFEKLFGLMEVRLEAMHTEAAEDMEETWWDEVGGEDKMSADDPPFPGLKSHVTRNGYAVDGTTTVAGIDAAVDARWLNRYCGPEGSNLNKTFAHDADDGITAAEELRRKMKKMARLIRYKSPNGANFAHEDKKELLSLQKIYADEIAWDALEQTADVLGHGSDHMTPKELDRPEPTFRGIPITWIEDLGVGAGGLPAYVMSSAGANTSRGEFGGGDFPNTGELYMINTGHLRPVFREGHTPLRKPLHFLWEQQLMVQLFRWLLTTVCRSRQRQGVIWGFAPYGAT